MLVQTDDKTVEKVLEKEVQAAEEFAKQDNLVCEFCGQVLFDNKECTCHEAVSDRRHKRITKEALNKTLPMLTEEEHCKKFKFEPINNEDLLTIIRDVIETVGYEVIQKATIKVDSDTQFTIQNKVSYIEIQRKENTSKQIKLGG